MREGQGPATCRPRPGPHLARLGRGYGRSNRRTLGRWRAIRAVCRLFEVSTPKFTSCGSMRSTRTHRGARSPGRDLPSARFWDRAEQRPKKLLSVWGSVADSGCPIWDDERVISLQGAGRTVCSWLQLPESCPLGLKFGSSLMMYSLEPFNHAWS